MQHICNYRAYPQLVQRDPELYRLLTKTNRNLYRVGFFLGFLTAGGCVLYKKVNELSREIKKMKEGTGK